MGRQFADGNENHVIAKQALSFKMFEMLTVNPNYSCNTKKNKRILFITELLFQAQSQEQVTQQEK